MALTIRAAISAVLISLVLFVSTRQSYAQYYSSSARFSTREPRKEEKKEEKPINDTDFIELGPRWDRQYMVLGDPKAFSRLQSDGFYFSGAYGWNTASKKAMGALTLKFGTSSSSGHLKAGGESSDRVGVFAPGFRLGQYLGKRLFLTEGLSMPLSVYGPGAEFDLLATIAIGRWFAIRFGTNVGYYRTGLPADGKRTNVLGVGPTLEFIFIPWGNYRQPE